MPNMKFLSPKDRPATEILNVRLLEGSLDRIDKVLRGGEIKAMFIREAIEAELQRRESVNSKIDIATADG